MTSNERQTDDFEIADFPAIRGLILRRYLGNEDIPAMASVINQSRRTDGVDFLTTEEDLAADFSNPLDFDPRTDILIAEADGKMIGLARVGYEDRTDGKKSYRHSAELLREWRGQGIREALFLHNERHILRIAKMDHTGGAGHLELWANDADNEWKSIILNNGYGEVQHVIDMVRSLDDIPEMPLPDGFEIRPVSPEHHRKIWEACKESKQKEWDYSENIWDDEHFGAFKKTHGFQPDLWQVAWKGDTLAGMVLNYIVDEENKQAERKRGHTEHVFVREQYRGLGLARALLARSFQVLKDRGMDDATLGMEVENPHDPMRLYEGMGFGIVKHYTWYRKPIA
ncbi:MAG: GNAT family N-acetyltransferase [Candidatus Thermoplasmatota archaeon]|nr:GNAT family N-acetyltransferase [Candidatus Thermoplasmatota archaeon]